MANPQRSFNITILRMCYHPDMDGTLATVTRKWTADLITLRNLLIEQRFPNTEEGRVSCMQFSWTIKTLKAILQGNETKKLRIVNWMLKSDTKNVFVYGRTFFNDLTYIVFDDVEYRLFGRPDLIYEWKPSVKMISARSSVQRILGEHYENEKRIELGKSPNRKDLDPIELTPDPDEIKIDAKNKRKRREHEVTENPSPPQTDLEESNLCLEELPCGEHEKPAYTTPPIMNATIDPPERPLKSMPLSGNTRSRKRKSKFPMSTSAKTRRSENSTKLARRMLEFGEPVRACGDCGQTKSGLNQRSCQCSEIGPRAVKRYRQALLQKLSDNGKS